MSIKGQLASMGKEEIFAKIEQLKNRLYKDVIILAHFYQCDDIIRFADFTGDSLQLAQQASKHKDVRFIICCAVSFMAEMVRILGSQDQEVLHPEPFAQCPLANMAGIEQVEAAWAGLKGLDRRIIPVAYVNSSAGLKAFCGKNEGAVCTSANARQVFNYIFSKDASVFFFPDKNLGLNTAHSLGIDDKEIFLWRCGRSRVPENLLKTIKVFLWDGYCYVHTEFVPSDILQIKNKEKGIKVIVHPECTPEVVALSDLSGSTGIIKNEIEKSGSGSKWAIGTEWHFVNRMSRQSPDKFIIPLRKSNCGEMKSITPQSLLRILESIIEGKPYGRVTVEGSIVKNAGSALSRMLEIA